MPAGLRPPPIPAALSHIWGWFAEISAARSGNGGGPNPIAYSEIEAWARLTGRVPEPRDIHAIKLLDAELMRVWAEQDRKRAEARRRELDRKARR